MMAEEKEIRPVLEAKNLKKVYGLNTRNEFEALHKINFKVMPGEFVGVMGPSGSGKSTFINNISTIDRPTEGRVYINGKDVQTMSEQEIGHFRHDNLGFIFQYFNLLKTHTMYENIAMPLALGKTDPKDIQERVEAVAKELNIFELLNKKPLECSGGQRQRAAIARALINNPTLIVADEPTGNLDSANSNSLMKLLRKLNQEKGVTVVMVSHDPLVVSYTTRLVYLRDGNIEKELIRGDMNQKEYFRAITDISSVESEGVFEI